jgi:hypothetical protein
MPTYESTALFSRQFARLTPQEQQAVRNAVQKFVHDLKAGGGFRQGLRVKPIRRSPGEWEMTWADDGRAVFRYGEQIRPGHAHVVWLRVGSHDVLDQG